MDIVPIPADLRTLAGCQGVVATAAERLGSIDDIGDAVCFLVSERASYINGAALVVDGSKSLVI